MGTVKYAFREKFIPLSKETLQWYPGHMERSFMKMQSKMKQVDCIIEVHDARVPISGRNPAFVKRLIGPKPHILVLNKKDLVEPDTRLFISKRLKNEIEHVVFTNCRDQHCRGLRQLVPRVVDLIGDSNRYNRTEERKLQAMVIGVPNVGKSSLINALRNRILHKGKASPVGAIAGVTRSVQNEIRIHIEPPVYLVDTPGILPPNIKNVDTGLKLALCSCLNDDVVGVRQIADYLLYWCNKNQLFDYVTFYGLDEPTDDITKVLLHIAVEHRKTIKVKDVTNHKLRVVPDLNYGALHFVKTFREVVISSWARRFKDHALVTQTVFLWKVSTYFIIIAFIKFITLIKD